MSAVSSYAGDGVLTSGGDSRPIEGFRRLYDPEGYFMHLDTQRRIVRSVVIIVGIAGVAGAGLIAQSARGVGRDFTQAEPRGQFFRMPDLGGGRLGVSVRDVTPSDVGQARLPSQAGAWITDVQADSPAAQADLRAGDVVVQFDGERVRSARQLSRLVGRLQPRARSQCSCDETATR